MAGKDRKAPKWHLISVYSGGDNRLGRALRSAGAAIQALLRVDLIMELAHVDRLGRTLGSAGAAGQALVGNHKSHDRTSSDVFAAFGRVILFFNETLQFVAADDSPSFVAALARTISPRCGQRLA